MQKDNSFEKNGKLDKEAVNKENEYYFLIYTKERMDAAIKYANSLNRLLEQIVEEP